MKEIAVIDSGIYGLLAAWLLSKNHKVTLYENAHYFGGHSNKVKLDRDGKEVAVDTGFIVYYGIYRL
jgi:predicted NAD/FAD-binding protein